MKSDIRIFTIMTVTIEKHSLGQGQSHSTAVQSENF